jgi:hypothetical protein
VKYLSLTPHNLIIELLPYLPQPLGDNLSTTLYTHYQITCMKIILWCEERNCSTPLTRTTSTTNTVDVVLHVVRALEVHDQYYRTDVQATSTHRGCYHYRLYALFEVMDSELPILGVYPTMHQQASITVLYQLPEQSICLSLLVYED